MPITAFTTYADVRAVLGVSEKDLSDSTLALDWYSDNLDEELAEVSATLADSFATASTATSPSPEQVRLVRSVRTFAATVVARTATTALRLAAPQQVTDGKAAMARFTDPLDRLAKDIEAKYQAAKAKVEAAALAVENVGNTSTSRVWFAVVSPSTDPVTG